MLNQIKKDLKFIGAELVSYVPEYAESNTGNWVIVIVFEGVIQVWYVTPNWLSNTWYLHTNDELIYPKQMGCITATPLTTGILAFSARQGKELRRMRKETAAALEAFRERST